MDSNGLTAETLENGHSLSTQRAIVVLRRWAEVIDQAVMCYGADQEIAEAALDKLRQVETDIHTMLMGFESGQGS